MMMQDAAGNNRPSAPGGAEGRGAPDLADGLGDRKGRNPARRAERRARRAELRAVAAAEAASGTASGAAAGTAAVPAETPDETPAPARSEAPPAPRGVRPPAGRARPKRRHWGLLAAFFLMVVVPVAASAVYLWTRAADQYASTVGFTVRREEMASAVDILGGLSNLSGGGGSSDTDILYEFIQSQEMVAALDARLDLRRIYGRAWPDDPVFALDPDASLEALVRYWRRVVRVAYDSGSGLIELRVLAFTPEDAHAVATGILEESTRKINALSAQAREDAMRYAREELDQAVARLKAAREAMTAFRTRTQIVDPNADIQGQMGLLNTLQQQLAEAMIELDLMRDTVRAGDPRIARAERRIEVIRARIAEERRKFGVAGVAGDDGTGRDYAEILAEYERLSVDREFAEQAYKAALAAYDTARAEADRQSRYLATFVRPTLAQTAEYPARAMLVGLVALFSFLAWAVASLIFYSLRDRR